MRRCASIVWLLLSSVALLNFAGCGSESPPLKAVRHLGDSMIEWKTGYIPLPQKVNLDQQWETTEQEERTDGEVYVARLADPVSSFGAVSDATALWNGKTVSLQPFENVASLENGALSVEPGRRIFKEMKAYLKSNGSATCAVRLRRGPAEFTVFASGDSAVGVAPIMLVLLNGELIARFDVTAEKKPEAYVANGEAAEGINLLEFQFTNDLFRPPEDRNLRVDKVKVIQTVRVFTLCDRGKGPPEGVELEYRSLPPGAEAYREREPAPGLVDIPGPWRYYEVGNDTAPAVPFSPPGRARFSMTIDEGTLVSVAYAVCLPTRRGARQPVVFEAFLQQNGERSRVDSIKLTPWAMDRTRRWVRRTFALDGYQPGRAELIFTSGLEEVEATGSASHQEEPIVLLAEPVVSASPPDPQETRNVILVSLDTLRADHLGCYGYERPTSPFLDTFARENILFETVIAQSSWTLPSHATMLSSLEVSAHGVVKKSHSIRNLEMLASILKRSGYHTKAVTDGGFVGASFGFPLGFESYEDYNTIGFKEILPAVEDWLRGYADRPFFLFVHTYDTHYPSRPPAAYIERFPTPPGVTPELLDGSVRNVPGHFDNLDDAERREADLQHMVNVYDASIMYADDGVKRLFGLLKELGKWDDTLVIVTSDHGEEFLEHGRMLHSKALYEETIRVPLIMHVPGGTEGMRIPGVARVLDISPTILDFLGVEWGENFQGESLLSRLNADSPASSIAYAELENLIARRRDSEKFIYDMANDESELFDLTKDPAEKTNLALSKKERARTLVRTVRDFREENRALLAGQTTETIELTGEVAEQLRRLGYMNQ